MGKRALSTVEKRETYCLLKTGEGAAKDLQLTTPDYL